MFSKRAIFPRPVLAPALALTLAGPAAASEPSEALFLMELPSVLTASRLTQSPLDVPAPVTVIDRDMIRASGFTEIHDVFRLVPGFLVADWPQGPPSVVNHGLGDATSRRLLVLVDGRSVFDPFRGGVDWQGLPLRLEDVERVEVVRGPNQASYGANAFQGVINIITRLPGADPGVDLVMSRGRRGFEDYYVRGGGSGAAFDWRVSFSSRELSRFEDRGAKPSFWDETNQRQVLNAHWAWRPDLRQEWRLQLGLSRGNDVAGTTLEPHKYPVHERGSDANFIQLAWRNSYAPGSEVSVQYYQHERKEREAYLKSNSPTLPTAWLPVEFGVDMRRDDIEFQQIHRFSPSLRGVWGAGLRHDQVESAHYLHGLGTVSGTQWQVFGNLDWQATPDWLLHAGAMLERHYLTDTLFSPRLAANYQFAPNHSLRLSAGRGYRAPTLFEARAREVYPGTANDIADVGYWSYLPLDPERVSFRELGYVGRFPALRLQVDARLYSDRYSRYIDSKTCNLDANLCGFAQPAGYNRAAYSWFGNAKANYFYNSGELHVYGTELTLDWRHPVWGRFVFSTAYSRVQAGAGINDADAELSAPRHASSLLWSKAFDGGWTTSLGYYRVGHFKWLNEGDDQWAYRRVDLKLARRLGKAGSEDEIALTVQNLNDRHVEFDEYYLVERQAFLTLRLGW
ncbi:MAG: TonB-dependent receptor [Pseudomonadota bacterium]